MPAAPAPASALPAGLLVPLAFVIFTMLIPAGCAATAPPEPTPESEPAPQTVLAERYKMFFLEDIRTWSGQWGHEIYFPERGIVFNVTFEFPDPLNDEHALIPTVHAFTSGIRNRYALEPHGPETVAEVEQIEVPLELAKEIFEFAELTRRQQEESRRIGRKQFELGNFPVVDPYLLKYEKTIREIEEQKASEREESGAGENPGLLHSLNAAGSAGSP